MSYEELVCVETTDLFFFDMKTASVILLRKVLSEMNHAYSTNDQALTVITVLYFSL